MALLHPSSEGLAPTALAVGPWGPETLAGQVVSGLVGREAERSVDATAWRGARLRVDLVRMTSLAPLTPSATVVHASRRLQLVDVELAQDGAVVARGRATFVARDGEGPAGRTWTLDTSMPAPPDQASRRGRHPFEQLLAFAGADPTGDNDPDRWADGDEPKYLWWNLDHQLVADEEMTPLTRAAYLSDTASPLTAWGSEGLGVINCDVDLSLARDPEGSMLGLEARDYLTGQGGASGSAVMHDAVGPVGLVSVVALTYPDSRRTHP